MRTEHEKEIFVCGRLRHMGFARGSKVKLYGDEFDLESNPQQQGSRYVIEAISHHSGALRRIALPMSITGLIEREFDVMDKIKLAA